MLIGVSLVLHGALGAYVVFMAGSSHPIEDIPLAVELEFAAPASSATATVPQDADLRPAEPVGLEPLPPAMPETVPTQPPPEAAQRTDPPFGAVPQPTPKPSPARRPVPPNQVPSPATFSQPKFPSPKSADIPNVPQRSAQLPLPSATPSLATALAAPSGVWRGALAAWMQSRKRYPDEARRRSTEGTVGVRFTVARDGQVLDAQIIQASGSDLLDQAALAMFRGARAPQFPADMAQQQVSITVAVRYRLAE